MLNKLQAELGPSGFQAVGVAFDAPNAALTGGQYVTAMADSLMLTYPVGYAQRAGVDTYLGRSGNDLLRHPSNSRDRSHGHNSCRHRRRP